MKSVTVSVSAMFVFTLLAAIVLAAPRTASAEAMPRLGGGNALLRNTVGVSNANIASSILARLRFASEQGGQPEDKPANEEVDVEEENTEEGDEDTNESLVNENATENANANASLGNGSNGGTQAGNGANGGNGGDAGPSGLVRAGNVVTNATAVNAINTAIIRLSL